MSARSVGLCGDDKNEEAYDCFDFDVDRSDSGLSTYEEGRPLSPRTSDL